MHASLCKNGDFFIETQHSFSYKNFSSLRCACEKKIEGGSFLFQFERQTAKSLWNVNFNVSMTITRNVLT